MKNKKLFMLMLAMCLSLTACGSAAKEESMEQDMISETTVAVAEEAPLLPVQEQEEQAPTIEDSDTLFIERLCGQWVLTQDAEGVPLEMQFNEDKTCTVDGTEYTWRVARSDGPCGTVEVLSGETVAYKLYYGNHNSGECAMIYYTDTDRGVYLNPDHYDVIEITADNWSDYFEVTRSFYWDEDAFGEVKGLRSCCYRLVLKEEYSQRLSVMPSSGVRLTKDAIEISYSFGWLESSIDLAMKGVTLGEGEIEFEQKITNTNEFIYQYHDSSYKTDIYIPVSGVKGDNIGIVYDIEVLRAACPLYLLKDGYRLEQ